MNSARSAPDRAASPPEGARDVEIRCSRCRERLYGHEGEPVTCPRCCRVNRG